MKKKLIAIVGSGPGVSLSIAEKFGSHGFQIALIARNESALQKMSEKLHNKGYKASFYVADVASEEAIKTTFQQIYQEHEFIDVLCYNAATPSQAKPSELTSQSMINDFRVNVVGALLSAQQVMESMKSKQRGTILFTGGGLALRPYYEYSSLAIGKAGIRNLTFSLAQELHGFGIRVGTVTIRGIVEKGTKFDPGLIAEKFWKLHSNRRNKHEIEIVFE
ncbi:MAG: SDR family NAD(P)-dependent oxidoreductase [Candidatus Cyclobacteriaceae bacterium M3_2C_046]